MKNMKTGLQFLLRGTVMIAFLAFGLVSCDQEELNLNNAENVQTANLSGNKGKIDICHYSADENQWFVASVNPKSWAEHSLHGDIRLDDQDGDGKIQYNECGIVGENGVDCNDLDPVNMSGTYCGTYKVENANTGKTTLPFELILEFVTNSCIAQVIYTDNDCSNETPANWSLIGTSKDTYTYLETDACGIDGCVVTVVNKDGELEISFDCPDVQDYILYYGVVYQSVDMDGDGYTTCNGDCDDTDASINPGTTEIPYNGIDDDCNSTTPDDDLDGDGYNHDIDCDDMTYSEDNTCCLTNETIRTAVSLWLFDQEAAIATYGHISTWCTSNVTDMSGLFNGASSFNENIGGWDVSSVTNMSGMFSEASEFNQDISKWKVSNVTDMSFMFGKAAKFNQDISEWVVSNVIDMTYMFNEAYAFSQDLRGWDVSQVNSCSNFSKQTDSWTEELKPIFVNCSPNN